MNFLELLKIITVITTCYLIVLWIVHLKQKKADIVDFGWASGIGISGIICATFGSGDPTLRVLVGAFSSIWSIRLSSYIFFTRVIKPEEDGRYQELREQWKDSAKIKFLIFFLLQGALVVFLTIPFMIISTTQTIPTTTQILIALILFIASILGERTADLQLHRFRENENNRGKTCRVGLWRFSRHPNYFFEWIHWLSYLALAISSPWFIFCFISPILMLYLILFVTGIPPTEARALKTRGDDYRNYQKTTSSFIPWFVKEK